jgi:hypothetical protein
MLQSGAVISRHENKFALTCPHGRHGDVGVTRNLIGAAVFTLSGLFVGTIYSDSNCYGLKFARHSSFFLDELLHMIQDELKKVVVLVKTNQKICPQPSNCDAVLVGFTFKRCNSPFKGFKACACW